ncbi:MAG: sigma-54-dependent Fis family transcriptional regulator [Nitrococcus mobilis]|nr:sigma-54-dependent Fis family transcriptional regulator [Nitrococcus mobilis]
MEKRKLLYLNASGTGALPSLEVLKERWDIHTATNLDQARQLIECSDFKVGLAWLEEKESKLSACEEVFLYDKQMAWVALLERASLQRPSLRRLIHQIFFDYHTLPTDLDRLALSLGHAYGMAALKTSTLPSEGQQGEYEMVGVSPLMRELFKSIRKMASVDAPVLIQGESGTGKELAAAAIHERSRRAKGPFVVVNCGALPSGLIQSELFGYERGAFTGAQQRKIGRIEAAHGGTLFLDEIGDLPFDMQVNLLRFLQEQTIDRVGGKEPIEVDVRVIAATHMDLEKAVADKGRFREDLYFRLNVLRLHMPPLRDRQDDIELLAWFFFNRFAAERGPAVKGFGRQALEAMNQHTWPGNVRELINRVRRAVVLCDKRLITPTDLGLERRQAVRRTMTLAEARDAAERAAITGTLRQADGNVSQAARQLNVSRVTLYRLMEKYRIRL